MARTPMTKEAKISIIQDLLRKYPKGEEGKLEKGDYEKRRAWCDHREDSVNSYMPIEDHETHRWGWSLESYIDLMNEMAVEGFVRYVKSRLSMDMPIREYSKFTRYNTSFIEKVAREHLVLACPDWDDISDIAKTRRTNRVMFRLGRVISRIVGRIKRSEMVLRNGTFKVTIDLGNYEALHALISASSPTEVKNLVETLIIPGLKGDARLNHVNFVGFMSDAQRLELNTMMSTALVNDQKKLVEKRKAELEVAEAKLRDANHATSIALSLTMI